METSDARIIKLIFVGEASVGKTSIISQWMNQPFTTETTPTIGAGMTPIQLNVDDSPYLIHVWDTAGTPQYRSVVPMFCRDTDIAIIVFDVTNKSSFDKVHEWYEFVHQNSDPAFILVGNKIDLAYGVDGGGSTDENLNDGSEHAQISRQVDLNAAKNLAEELKAPYFETSCLTKDGIEDLKNGVREAISMFDSSRLCYSTGKSSSKNIQTLKQDKSCC